VRVTGPTGAGKTAPFFMLTLMRSWKGLAIIHDGKSNFWLLLQGSSRWRHNLLFTPTPPDSVRYNPMAALAPERIR
jgi:type IV secretion system protein VirD4